MTADESDAALVMVVDDDAAVCWALEQALREEGHRVKVVADAGAARRSISRQRPDLVLTDIRMPGESGLDLLADLQARYSHLPVIVMTAHGTMETAIEAVKRGAFDYLPKPIDLDRLGPLVKRALGEDRLVAASRAVPDRDAEVPTSIIGSTPAMQEVYRRIAAAAATDMGVLIAGPSGSGKELVARALHTHSRRADQPFIAVNCGALPDNLVESELFGHEAGAFTDAKEAKEGRVEAADGGTLFLDEIGELPLTAQVKLLRFLEDHRIQRLGSTTERRVDVRVIAATNRDLTAMITAGGFRSDLGYRLRVVEIQLPALVERLDDLPALVRHFLDRTAERLARQLAVTDEAMDLLRCYSWPGNVRELKHVVEEAAVLATGGIIGPEHLRIEPAVESLVVSQGRTGFAAAVQLEVARLCNQHPGEVVTRLADLVDEPLFREALSRNHGNQLRTAEMLGINRITLKKRMDQLGIGRA